ncbi:hypothetical protein ACIQXD_29280 [Streptomyces uncialis]|uniref:hypothetical protein n=1 Tax=Streptomyces uncialis TaxID=1048205 RepID=UPI0038044730
MLKNASIRRVVTLPALGMLLAGAFSVGAGGTASASGTGVLAHPTGCRTEVGGRWGTLAECNNHNGGSYRAIAVCKEGGTGPSIWSYGPWRQFGYSRAYCNGSTVATSAGIESSPRNNT